ncbi:MAG TPA: sugar transferase [Burkholderiaceae bacterium]|nr:sugar transferase [Burkholderiaceae bacterium]
MNSNALVRSTVTSLPHHSKNRARDFRFHPFSNHLENAIDRLCGLALLIALSPLMAYVAWRIWREDGAPVLFAHWRVGKQGRLFRCYKFRSMLRNSEEVLARLLTEDPQARAEWERDQKLRNDPRITRIGHFLRKTSLDELPQLLNVVKGEMSLVGPRPITLQELKRYGPAKPHYLAVKPGMTGLWQVSGRNNTTYDRRVELDRHYVESRCALLNAWILFKTVLVVVTRDGAC